MFSKHIYIRIEVLDIGHGRIMHLLKRDGLYVVGSSLLVDDTASMNICLVIELSNDQCIDSKPGNSRVRMGF